MEQPKIAQKSPIGLEVKQGKKYWWCTCGHSTKQPFCDGKHKGTGISPTLVVFEEDKKVWWCGCKHTSSELGLCDGAHKKL